MRDLLTGMVSSNLTTMYTDVNEKTGEIAAQVGQTPQGWNGNIFSMIQNLSDSVIVPIAGMIITFVLCYELISMLTEKNNMHDLDTWMFFKYFFKMWVAVWIVSHTFTITMAVFDVGQTVVSRAAGVISSDTAINIDTMISTMETAMESMEIGELVILALETMLVSLCMKIISVLITVILYKEFDEKTEKKGLGTPATRASTIEKLVASGYAQRKGKQIIPTAEGRELIRVMPENLKSAGLTAEWENRLLLMERGELNGEQFMDDIVAMLKEILNGCRKIPEEERNRFQTAKELIGKCPVCGSDIFEGKRNFYCSNRQCDFALWKDNRFLEGMEKKLDKKMAKELLDKACTHVKGLYSKKKDARFDADLLMTLENGKPKFHLEFPKRKHKG